MTQTSNLSNGSGNNCLLTISNQKPFDSGFHRDTYLHPEDSSLVLKVVRKQNPARRSDLFGRNKNRFRDPNEMEYEMWQNLKSNQFDKSGYFSEVKGWVQTDLGRALCVERLISDDDFPPIILRTLTRRSDTDLDPELKRFIMSSLKEFFNYVISNGIYSFAWRLENLAIYKQNGELKLKSFDSKSMTIREWLPISKYFKLARQIKIRRRTNKLLTLMHQSLYG